jgi:membrane protein required for colicin V production
MSWLDIVIIVIAAVGAFYGLKMGLIKAVLSLAGLVLGIFLAGQFYDDLGALMTFIKTEGVANGVAFAIILIGVMVIASVLASFLKWAASIVMLGWVNHVGGTVFGLFMGALLCGALLTLWKNTMNPPQFVADSALAQFLLDKFPIVLGLLPKEFDAVRSFFE